MRIVAFKAVTAAVPSILFDTGFSLWNSWGFFKSYGLVWGSCYLSGCFGSQRSEGRDVRGDRCVFVPTLLVLSSKPSIAGYNFAFVPGPQPRIVWFPQLHSINHVPSIVEIQYSLFDQSETLPHLSMISLPVLQYQHPPEMTSFKAGVIYN